MSENESPIILTQIFYTSGIMPTLRNRGFAATEDKCLLRWLAL